MKTIGHERVIESLRNAEQRGRLAHAYLFTGPSQIGKTTLATDLACIVNCQHIKKPCGECGPCKRILQGIHADVKIVRVSRDDATTGNRLSIGIDQIRQLEKEANLKPYEGTCRVFIVEETHLMSSEAANALLKTLEEPPDQVIILLLSSEPHTIPVTVVSRCQQMNLYPIAPNLIYDHIKSTTQLEDARIQEIASESYGRMGWAIQVIDQREMFDKRQKIIDRFEDLLNVPLSIKFSYANELVSKQNINRDEIVNELKLLQLWFRDMLMLYVGSPNLVVNYTRIDSLLPISELLSHTQIIRAIKDIDHSIKLLKINVGTILVLEQLMLRLPIPKPR